VNFKEEFQGSGEKSEQARDEKAREKMNPIRV
jgi:hypothetical protein